MILPFPPTVNTYWRNVKGRTLLSEDGRYYRKSVAQECLVQRPEKFGNKRISVSIYVYAPDARRRDLDNLFKGILDGLAHAGIYEDDSQVDRLSIQRCAIDREQPRVEVDICAI